MSVHFYESDVKPKKCFLCNRDLKAIDGYILWCNGDKSIAFHKNCAAEFSAHLGSDLIKFKHEKRKLDEIDIF